MMDDSIATGGRPKSLVVTKERCELRSSCRYCETQQGHENTRHLFGHSRQRTQHWNLRSVMWPLQGPPQPSSDCWRVSKSATTCGDTWPQQIKRTGWYGILTRTLTRHNTANVRPSHSPATEVPHDLLGTCVSRRMRHNTFLPDSVCRANTFPMRHVSTLHTRGGHCHT